MDSLVEVGEVEEDSTETIVEEGILLLIVDRREVDTGGIPSRRTDPTEEGIAHRTVAIDRRTAVIEDRTDRRTDLPLPAPSTARPLPHPTRTAVDLLPLTNRLEQLRRSVTEHHQKFTARPMRIRGSRDRQREGREEEIEVAGVIRQM